MSEYILLRDIKRCPHCGNKPISKTSSHCGRCGMRLFFRPIDFAAYEADGNPRRYWLWTNDRGWIYRDFVMSPDAAPQTAAWEFTSPERNTKTAEERLDDVRRETDMKKQSITPRRNQVGYGRSRTAIAGR